MDVIIVDEKDNQTGVEEKIKAHKEAKLHRGFSVFVFNSKNQLLLQRRSLPKYHSPGLWTNTCCSHPRPGEDLKQEAKLRLKYEMGIECELKEMFTFMYKEEFDNSLTEHEFDHVFFGRHDNDPEPDSSEVSDWKWVSLDELKQDIEQNPQNYSAWLKACLNKVIETVKLF